MKLQLKKAQLNSNREQVYISIKPYRLVGLYCFCQVLGLLLQYLHWVYHLSRNYYQLYYASYYSA